MLRRNGPVVKSVESVLRLEGSLWGKRFVEARLDKFWHNHEVVYDFKAQLQGTGSRSECLYEES